MTAFILKGTKQEIAEQIAKFEGEIREAIVFVEHAPQDNRKASLGSSEDIFQEMEPYMVKVGTVDYSR